MSRPREAVNILQGKKIKNGDRFLSIKKHTFRSKIVLFFIRSEYSKKLESIYEEYILTLFLHKLTDIE